MPTTVPPKYPVCDEAPGILKTVGNFNLGDYATIAATSAVSVPVGMLIGKGNSRARVVNTCVAMGAFAGYLMAYQNSSGRLLGYLPNDAEERAAKRKGLFE